MRIPNRIVLAIVLVALSCGTASAQGADVPAPSFGAVMREVPRDLWKFLSWDTAIVLGIGGGAAGGGRGDGGGAARSLEVPVLGYRDRPGYRRRRRGHRPHVGRRSCGRAGDQCQ